MQFSNFASVYLIISSSFFLACSSDKQESTANITTNNEIKIRKIDNSSIHSQGLKIYKDPVSGKFLSAPPKNNDELGKNKQTVTKPQDNNLNDKNKVTENPDGTRYIKTPAY